MKWIIEVEETVKMHHQIIVDIDNEGQLERALDNAGDYCTNLDEYTSLISDITPVLEVNEECYAETDHVEYFDDYEDDAI